MNAKEYLEKAYRLDLKISSKIEQIERLRALAYKVTSSLGDKKVAGTKQKSPMESAIIKIIMAENEINKEIDMLVSTKSENACKINQIISDEQRILLELRYLCFNSWEQIAIKMQYSSSYVYKLHACALKSFDKVLNMKDCD
jgi:DNA-directed RNA polymerase specialized sigma subunit